MDYTVGSLADLISGKNTPNKPKVKIVSVNNSIIPGSIKNKKDKPPKNTLNNEEPNITGSVGKKKKNKRKYVGTEESAIEPVAKKIQKEKFSSSLNDGEQNISNSVGKIKKHKKRKSLDNEDPSVEPALKKAKKEKRKSKTNSKENTLVDTEDESLIKVRIEDGKPQNENKKNKINIDPEELERTVFVGNVPINTQKKQIKKVFKKYGEIESVRFRGIPVADIKIPKKVAAIKKEFHPDRKSVYCYIRYINKESAQEAVKEDGSIFNDHHIRVHLCGNKEKQDESKAIFIGNLSFSAEEEELWKLFEPCGPISSIRIIRDSITGMGKGFAYVNFKDSDAVQLALEMENVKLGNRELRIKLSSINTAKKNKKKENKINATRRKNFKDKKSGIQQNGDGDNKAENIEKSTGFHNKGFQGYKFNKNKKKFKVNKGALDKKKKIKKIAPISK